MTNPKLVVNVTRNHYIDIQCAAENSGQKGKDAWDKLHAEYEFSIDEVPVTNKHYGDFGVCFMYL